MKGGKLHGIALIAFAVVVSYIAAFVQSKYPAAWFTNVTVLWALLCGLGGVVGGLAFIAESTDKEE